MSCNTMRPVWRVSADERDRGAQVMGPQVEVTGRAMLVLRGRRVQGVAVTS